MKLKKYLPNGFTLLELMIVVAIVGILASISFAGYSKQAIKNRRTEGKNILYEVMQRQERYMSENNTYTTTLTNLGYASPLLSDSGYYKVTAAANSTGITDGVILTAAPQGAQLKDTDCSSLLLNSNGQKTSSTSSTSCW